MDYDGGRTRSDIVSRALDLFSDNAPPPELLEVRRWAGGVGEAGAAGQRGYQSCEDALCLLKLSSLPAPLKRS